MGSTSRLEGTHALVVPEWSRMLALLLQNMAQGCCGSRDPTALQKGTSGSKVSGWRGGEEGGGRHEWLEGRGGRERDEWLEGRVRGGGGSKVSGWRGGERGGGRSKAV